MPVVEKISKIEFPNDKYENGERVFIDSCFPRTFGMMDEARKNYLFRFNGFQLQKSESLVESVYLGVIDFIKRHTAKESDSI